MEYSIQCIDEILNSILITEIGSCKNLPTYGTSLNMFKYDIIPFSFNINIIYNLLDNEINNSLKMVLSTNTIPEINVEDIKILFDKTLQIILVANFTNNSNKKVRFIYEYRLF